MLSLYPLKIIDTGNRTILRFVLEEQKVAGPGFVAAFKCIKSFLCFYLIKSKIWRRMPAPSPACWDELVAANATLVSQGQGLHHGLLEWILKKVIIPELGGCFALAEAHSWPGKYFWHLEDNCFELQGLLTGQRISLKNRDWIEAMYMGAGDFGDLKVVRDGDSSQKCAKLALE
ncbi:hypothetical protein SELMODRAFT_407927 [Selaginella moellendorffii]|uniref:Uncharacterized protein n=1 Tax=Selaginella moellendorffii TaxID=88036 RepID=D8R578_SELML|nr:hypothetical protein SELMODRAFT_407927 [Selaginella moellendorffii]